MASRWPMIERRFLTTWAGVAGLLVLVLLPSGSRAEEQISAVKAAVERALPGIVRGAVNYPNHRGCFSCHHQALPLMTLTLAKDRGFSVEDADVRSILDFSLLAFAPEEKHERLRAGRGHRTSVIGSLLATLASLDYPADATTAALLQYMLSREDADGGWRDTLQRPPSQGSAFTVTAVTLVGLNRYGDADEVRSLSDRIQATRGKALQWLLEAEPLNTEDRVFQLRGLVAGGAEASSILKRRDMLLREQRPDGSWGQLPELVGDAYATGSALVALREAGLSVDHPAFIRGLRFLLNNQQADGSWFVETRARPVQAFFDNGDPGGKSQFISFAATNWATLALLEALPAQRVVHSKEPKMTPAREDER